MFEIWAKWTNGDEEKVDEAECRYEAASLVSEYAIAFMNSVQRVWLKEVPGNGEEE
jgi:hypothetical protein